MNQLDLVLPMARRTDPGTSHAAAVRARSVAPSHRNIILAALRNHPGTVYSLEANTGIPAHAIGKRMKELERMGLARPTGDEVDGCRVWEVL